MTKKTFFKEKLAKNPKTNKLWSILGPVDNQNIELCNPFHMEPKKNLMWVRAPKNGQIRPKNRVRDKKNKKNEPNSISRLDFFSLQQIIQVGWMICPYEPLSAKIGVSRGC